MNSYPTLHLEIRESASGTASHRWPATQSFPSRHDDRIFSLPRLNPVACVAIARVLCKGFEPMLEKALYHPTIH